MGSPPSRVAVAAVVASLSLLAGPAGAGAQAPERPDYPPGAGTQQEDGDRGDGGRGGAAGDAADPAASPAEESGAGEDSRPLGTVNPLAIRNPFCDAGGLRRAERRNCRVTGTPEGRYPTSNYAFDVHIDTGLDNISGNFASMLAQIANAIWQFCLFILNIVLTVLGWAFSLSPFTDNGAMREIDSGLGRFYAAFTEPWLVVAMVMIGAFALYRGIVRREVSATIAGTLLAVALMLVAMWVIHDPRATIGTLTGYVNATALSVLAAPQSGSVANPAGDYGEATGQVWHDMTLPGFAVLNFSNVDWALAEPDAELLETANEYVCADAAYLAQLPPRAWAASLVDPFKVDCRDFVAEVPAPRTNADIWLRSSKDSPARERLWEEHHEDAPYASYLAIQGESGAATRLPLVLLIATGLLGGILLLAWIAMRLFMQSAVAFVLVLLAPLALFLPAFGEGGRRGFATWGSLLLGALVSKLVYAALLAVVLLATTVIGSLVSGQGGVGATMAFLAMAALWWAVLLNRNTLLSFLSVSPEAAEGHGRLGSMLGLYSIATLGNRLTRGESGRRRGPGELKDGLLGDRHDRREATTHLARRDLARRGESRLDRRLEDARGAIAEQDQRRERLAQASSDRGEAQGRAKGDPVGDNKGPRASAVIADAPGAPPQASERERALRRQIAAHEPQVAEAQALVGGAAERERAGQPRWTASQRAASREAIRREADRPVSERVHAWRAGLSPARYTELEGAERERIHGDVAKQLGADRAAFGAIADRPQGTVKPRASRRYRRELLGRPGGKQRLHAERKALTRRRRAAQRRARRGVSR